jgi:hypothetical protein
VFYAYKGKVSEDTGMIFRRAVEARTYSIADLYRCLDISSTEKLSNIQVSWKETSCAKLFTEA